jgi:hypothetical protein
MIFGRRRWKEAKSAAQKAVPPPITNASRKLLCMADKDKGAWHRTCDVEDGMRMQQGISRGSCRADCHLVAGFGGDGAASTMICVPTSLSQEVGTALGAQAGEAKLREVITAGGFASVRRATETPFNMTLEARL